MNNLKILIFLFTITLCFTQCSVEDFGNPNSPSESDLLDGASSSDLQAMLTGVESVLRNDLDFHYNTTAIVGREYYDMSGSDPRYISELMGENGQGLDNNGFLTTRAYAQVYRVVRNANNLLVAIENAQEAALSDAGENGARGIANTLKAYSLLLESGRQFENGMRIDVADLDNQGPIVTGYQNTLSEIETILDEAAADLSNAGESLELSLSPGFASLNTVSGFRQFNRAIASRLNAYQNDNEGLKSALAESFLVMDGSFLNLGAYHIFGLSGNDIPNPLVVVPGQDNFYASNDFVNDAELGDQRLSLKNTSTGDTIALQDVTVNDAWRVALYTTQEDDIPLIRNEELILLMAEARLNDGNAMGAVDAINIVRNAAGLNDYSGPMDADAVLDQLLYERRYSLYGEGHRWIDARRYNRFSELPLERDGDIIHIQFPIPVTENEG